MGYPELDGGPFFSRSSGGKFAFRGMKIERDNTPRRRSRKAIDDFIDVSAGPKSVVGNVSKEIMKTNSSQRVRSSIIFRTKYSPWKESTDDCRARWMMKIMHSTNKLNN